MLQFSMYVAEYALWRGTFTFQAPSWLLPEAGIRSSHRTRLGFGFRVDVFCLSISLREGPFFLCPGVSMAFMLPLARS